MIEVLIAAAIVTVVVLIDIACPNDLHGEWQYREDWIAMRNVIDRALALCGVSIFRSCSIADRMMAMLFHDPVWRDEWNATIAKAERHERPIRCSQRNRPRLSNLR